MPILDVDHVPELDAAVAPFWYIFKFGRPRFARLIQGLTPAQLATRPAGFNNSISALVVHVAAAEVNFAHWMQGKEVPAALKAEFMMEQPDDPLYQPEGETVESLQAKLDKAAGLVQAAMATVKAADLERAVDVGAGPHVTVAWLLSLTAYHSANHFGQLQMIKQHLG
jgi:uncharacterized damage-inducible protein DinB